MAEEKNYKYIDYLEEDADLPGQNWVCMSFLSPESISNCSLRGVKVRGVYNSKEEADTRCKDLQGLDPDFHVFVGQVGKWLPWDPEPDSQGDQVYREKQLNDLMKGYKENRASARHQEAERQSSLKQDMIMEEKNRHNSNSRKETTRERLRKKLEKRKLDAQSSDDIKTDKKLEEVGEVIVNKHKNRKRTKKYRQTDLEKELEEQSKLANKEGERLSEVNNLIQEEEEKTKEINKNIAKIKNLWNKMKDNENDESENVASNNN